jgi:hypothetical protein
VKPRGELGGMDRALSSIPNTIKLEKQRLSAPSQHFKGFPMGSLICFLKNLTRRSTDYWAQKTEK